MEHSHLYSTYIETWCSSDILRKITWSADEETDFGYAKRVPKPRSVPPSVWTLGTLKRQRPGRLARIYTPGSEYNSTHDSFPILSECSCSYVMAPRLRRSYLLVKVLETNPGLNAKTALKFINSKFSRKLHSVQWAVTGHPP